MQHPQTPNPLTPEQVQQMQRIVKQALSVLLDEDNAYMLVEHAEQGDPKQVVLQAVMPLLKNIYGAASGAGVKVDMVVVLAAGIQIVAMAAKTLEAGGVLKEAEIPAFCADVVKMATAEHNAAAQGQQGAQPPQPGAAPPPAGGMMNQGAPA